MFTRLLILFCAILCAPLSAFSEEYPIQNVARLTILPGYPTNSGHMVAAHIQLRDGWKTYWRAPGGNGIPPVFDWTGSKNVAAVRFHWPRPTVFVDDAGQTLGYKKELVLPISVIPKQAAKSIALKGTVTFGVCEDICIPVKARFSVNVSGTDTQGQAAIRSALAKAPKTAKAAGVHVLKCVVAPIEGGFRLTATLTTRSPLPTDTLTVFEFPHPEVWVEQDQTSTRGKTLTASANLHAYGDTPLILDRSKIIMTILGGKNAIELRGCPS